MPIGLCEDIDTDDADDFNVEDGGSSRICDDTARGLLGARSGSVFPCPCRSAARLAAEGTSHRALSAENRRRTGKGLSVQAAAISTGIHRVDQLLIEGPADPSRLLEAHPELCFRAFTNESLKHSKTSAEGIDERLTLLETQPEYQKDDWRRLAHRLADENNGRTGMDDLIDAICLAVTAATPREHFHCLPANAPRDAKGLPMQMVYRCETAIRTHA